MTLFPQPAFFVVNNYSIYSTDKKAKGFQAIEFDGFITNESVQKAKEMLDDAELAEKICAHNYELARQYFSYRMLKHKLQGLLDHSLGTNGNGRFA